MKTQFSIIDMEDLPEFKTELSELFQLLTKRNDKNSMLELLNQNEKYQNIDKDTAYMIKEFANIKLLRKSKKGSYNMCKAIEDLKKENQEQGQKRLLIELVGKKINKKKDIEQIMEELEEEKTVIEPIYNLIKDNPNKTTDELLDMLEEIKRQKRE